MAQGLVILGVVLISPWYLVRKLWGMEPGSRKYNSLNSESRKWVHCSSIAFGLLFWFIVSWGIALAVDVPVLKAGAPCKIKSVELVPNNPLPACNAKMFYYSCNIEISYIANTNDPNPFKGEKTRMATNSTDGVVGKCSHSVRTYALPQYNHTFKPYLVPYPAPSNSSVSSSMPVFPNGTINSDSIKRILLSQCLRVFAKSDDPEDAVFEPPSTFDCYYSIDNNNNVTVNNKAAWVVNSQNFYWYMVPSVLAVIVSCIILGNGGIPSTNELSSFESRWQQNQRSSRSERSDIPKIKSAPEVDENDIEVIRKQNRQRAEKRRIEKERIARIEAEAEMARINAMEEMERDNSHEMAFARSTGFGIDDYESDMPPPYPPSYI